MEAFLRDLKRESEEYTFRLLAGHHQCTNNKVCNKPYCLLSYKLISNDLAGVLTYSDLACFWTRDSDGRMLIHRAALDGNYDLIKFFVEFLEKGSAYNVFVDFEDKYKNTALLLAVINRHKDVVRHLLGFGADINHRNVAGRTAVHEVARSGNTELANMLFDWQNQNVEINTYDHNFHSPLDFAIINNDLEMVNLLLVHGAQLSPRIKMEKVWQQHKIVIDVKDLKNNYFYTAIFWHRPEILRTFVLSSFFTQDELELLRVSLLEMALNCKVTNTDFIDEIINECSQRLVQDKKVISIVNQQVVETAGELVYS